MKNKKNIVHCDICDRNMPKGWYDRHLKSQGHINKEDLLKQDSRSEDNFNEALNLANTKKAITSFEKIEVDLEKTYQTGYEAGVRDTYNVFTALEKLKKK